MLSATLIVRNEAAHLHRCLSSLRTLADEVVVVDTGSTDSTPAIAASFGARIFTYRWNDDFAAARNYALSHARGSWILYIDADECARPVDRGALDEALLDPQVIAATVRFRNRTGTTRYHEYRLFRNDPRIRFRHQVHETMLHDVQQLVAANGGRVVQTDLALDHFGYDGDQGWKHRRYIPLLRARLAEDPTHVYSWNHLGHALAALGDTRGAEQAWRRAVGIVRERGIQNPIDALPFGSLLVASRDEQDAELLDDARTRFPDDLLFRWMHGRRLADAQRWAEALEFLEPLARIDPDTFCSEDGIAYDVGIFGEGVWEVLALCHFRLGRYADSARYYGLAASAPSGSRSHQVKQQLAQARAAQTAPPA